MQGFLWFYNPSLMLPQHRRVNFPLLQQKRFQDIAIFRPFICAAKNMENYTSLTAVHRQTANFQLQCFLDYTDCTCSCKWSQLACLWQCSATWWVMHVWKKEGAVLWSGVVLIHYPTVAGQDSVSVLNLPSTALYWPIPFLCQVSGVIGQKGLANNFYKLILGN